MKLFWSVAQQEFQKLDNLLNNSLTVNNLILVLILMKLSVLVLPFKVVLFVDKILKMEESLLLMLPHYH